MSMQYTTSFYRSVLFLFEAHLGCMEPINIQSKDTSADSSSPLPPRRPRTSTSHFTKSQLWIIILGILGLILAKTYNYEFTRWNRYPTYIYEPSDYDRAIGWEDEPIGTVKWWKCTEDGDLPGTECGYAVYVTSVNKVFGLLMGCIAYPRIIWTHRLGLPKSLWRGTNHQYNQARALSSPMLEH